MITKPGTSKKYGFHFTDHADYMVKWENEKGRYSNNPEHRKQITSNKLKSSYGITLEEKAKMILDQDNKCLRCGLPFEGEGKDGLAPTVDHDHSFGVGDPDSVRGILHGRCNTRLGVHNDSIEELQLSIDYLKKYGVKK